MKIIKSKFVVESVMKKFIQFNIIAAMAFFFSACPEKKEGVLDDWSASMLYAVNFKDQGNGTVLDLGSGRIWMKCTHGQVWDGTLNTCGGTGGPTSYGASSVAFCTLPGACVDPLTLQSNSGPAFIACNDLTFAGHTDWRLPTQLELLGVATGMVNRDQYQFIFPQTPDDKYFWTGEQSTEKADYALGVSFAEGTFGNVLSFDKVTSELYVRCIR